MSQGPGHLQRAILDTLAARPGGDLIVDTRGRRALLACGVHDLRAISREMARAAGTLDCDYATSVWKASFSRSVAALTRRRKINVVWAVPLQGVEPEFAWPVAEVDGTIYMRWYSRQRRFVRM